ncbi:hypothetical protein G5B31_11565 [Rhodobacter sp. SGA-6-6]|uniref:hypothetical protein n=1 Tax=Rhodobacter sp. SGA-6-6 TaxID=2710882 RepID=UPI0013EE16A5|nr:hypothetical protein [Rhodobacter sp. SGA-6-6]NGM46172.1 hypothetical protein [Rhodobacter sp. SGA-6-6]
MSTNDPGPAGGRLRDFPAVFLSYDEPWADAHWRDLRALLPHAVRVHGVKGLDACHKAAADAVAGDWVVTVDADTRLGPALADAPVPRALLTGDFRLDWLSRNAVNGLWSGNGCVKLWPKALLREMRTHEAAEGGAPSLDHDIGGIRPGRSAQVTMPERDAMTEPAQTAFLAFRAGLRETVFLRRMAEEVAARRGLPGWTAETSVLRLISVWCSIGRHAPNGLWLLYGARLGLALPGLRPGWDPAGVNDYDRIADLWAGQVMPRYLRGGRADPGWNWERLETDLRSIGAGLGIPLAEFDSASSRLAARLEQLSPAITPSRGDSAGFRLQRGSRSAEGDAAARGLLEIAAALDHPAAFDNLGRLHAAGRMAGADPARAAWLFRAAAAMGNPQAAGHLAELPAGVAAAAPPARLAQDLPVIRAGPGGAGALRRALRACAGPLCLLLDRGVQPGPAFATHVPDPALAAGGRVLGYMGLCAVTGLPRPEGIRLAAPEVLAEAPGRPAEAVLPVVLGLLPAPASAMEALRGGLRAGTPPLLAGLGRDVRFGGHWVLGALLALAGGPPDAAGMRRLAALQGAGLETRVAAAARAAAGRTGQEVPVWTAEESRALKAMIPAVPARPHWTAAAGGLAGLGAYGAERARVMAAAALAIWGAVSPAACR